MSIRRILLELSDGDYREIKNAIERRQTRSFMPDGESNMDGALLADICRGWMELQDTKLEREPEDDEA